ncbi:hypothetical protein QU481_10955 [Crenobacter sp. SG2303]|uniref:Uncharacterized protein n=1 Tax=Crenobacter oryzisoli TaxID=3056844 RepID=A0ABT7XNN9_9NEIS|nr:hypothetical protein [Crenobacter sp. SG2303]MDN0075409.1 hypothetical protein [Crenobacter sp. SG2303]
MHADDVNGMKVEDRPKWFNQVLQRIERVAQHDDASKAFLADATESLKAMQVAKDKTVARGVAASEPVSSVPTN